LSKEQLSEYEKWFPLRVLVCDECWLVQTEDSAAADELFGPEYAYFSGFATSWIAHCQRYVAEMVDRFHLNRQTHFVEVASNDGTLLEFAVRAGMRATGIEPTHATAETSRGKGHTVVEEFLGRESGARIREEYGPADVIAANNVLAHVPDINSFVEGVASLLAPQGVATFEFPHLVNMIEGNQFDTIYHEHYSYLSLTAVRTILCGAGLRVFDVQEFPTHGGSLRVFVEHGSTGAHGVSESVEQLLADEDQRGMKSRAYYESFQESAEKIKNDALRFLLKAVGEQKTVAAYGAAAKGNTLLNFAGVRPDLIAFVADLNPAKQGKFLPGSRIPVVGVDVLQVAEPDYIVILPWNIRGEVVRQLEELGESGTRFVTFVPELEVSEK